MFYLFEFFVKEKDMNKAKISEVLAFWGGESLSLIPRKYSFDSKLSFESFPESVEYYRKFRDGKLYDYGFDVGNYVPLALTGAKIIELATQANRDIELFYKNDIIDFFEELSKLETYGVSMIRDEEYIDEFCIVKNEKEVVELVRECLNWETPKGVFIIKHSSRK